MILVFDWEGSSGYKNVLTIIDNIIMIIRWVVPIGLVIMTSVDVSKKVINPEEKDGMKIIMHRIIAAVIVFLVPTMINLLLKIVDIGKTGTNTSSNNVPSDSSNSNNNNTTITNGQLSIDNCPSSNMVIKVGDTLSLTALTPDNYDGTLRWSKNISDDYVSIDAKNNGKKLDYQIKNYPPSGNFTIMLNAGSVSKTCKINVQNDTIGDISIVNCPDNSKLYNIGDKIVLYADATNASKLTWSVFDTKVLNVNQSTDGKMVTLTVLNYDAKGYVIVRLSNGPKTETCRFSVRSSSAVTGDLSIENCPKTKVKVGESFTINSNEVSMVNYYNDIYSKYFELIDNKNGTATIKVIEHYSDFYPVRLRAQSQNGKKSYCSFYTYK